jgi:hypothetical protein
MFGLIFNYWIRRRWGGWWRSYNYITAAGLDSGLILSTIVIFFAITFPGVSAPNWWGNTAPFETMVGSPPYRQRVHQANIILKGLPLYCDSKDSCRRRNIWAINLEVV